MVELYIPFIQGRTVSHAIGCRPLTEEAPVQSDTSPCGICGRQRGIRTCFFMTPSVFPCQYHSSTSPYPYFMHVPSKICDNSYLVSLSLSLVAVEEMLPKSYVPTFCMRSWLCLRFLASLHCRSLFVTSRTYQTSKQIHLLVRKVKGLRA